MRRTPRGKMGAYRRLSPCMAAFFAIYTSIVMIVESEPGRGEFFPVASWSLFTIVPNVVDDFTARICEIDEVALPEPLYFADAGEFFPAATSHMPHNVLQQFGGMLAKEDPGLARLRARFEALYLLSTASQVRYEIVARRYDPLRRSQTGEFLQLVTLGGFEARRP